MDGQTACKVNPTAAIVTIASPIASDRLRSSVFQQRRLIDFVRFQIQQRRDKQHHEQFRVELCIRGKTADT